MSYRIRCNNMMHPLQAQIYLNRQYSEAITASKQYFYNKYQYFSAPSFKWQIFGNATNSLTVVT